jgi:hypothetical protein
VTRSDCKRGLGLANLGLDGEGARGAACTPGGVL